MPLSEETRVKARQIVARYPQSRSALLPMLHLVQAEEGYVTPDGITLCARELGLTKAEVGAVATFYTMYKRRPVGEWLVSVCTNLSCQLLGGDEIFARLSQHLGVGHDETTPDGRFTLEHAECLAACDYAPVVTINYEFYDNQTPETALALVSSLERDERPRPTRGEDLVGFRAISRELAGFVERDAAVRISQAATAGAPAHPEPARSRDSRGTVETAGTDVGLPSGAGDYGVPEGVTEGTLPDRAAAATYGTDATLDAGDDPAPGRDDRAGTAVPTMNNPTAAGHAEVSEFADPAKGFTKEEPRDPEKKDADD